MSFLSQVVWSEGMYLGPHEFQAQARYFESAIHFAASSLWFCGYGLTGLQLDHEALRNGSLSLLHASGLLSDGTPFQIPDADPRPTVRALADLFPPTQDSLTVYLGMNQRSLQGKNTALLELPELTRYSAETRTLKDETSGSDPRPVQMRRKNLRLLLETEISEGLTSLPLARVKRDGKGHFIFDEEFVPPCLQISASERLMTMVRRLIDILEAKSDTLARSASGKGGVATISSRDMASFWLRHAVNSGLAGIRHLWMTKRGHPEEMFAEMSRLGGALCTFALDSHPRDLPAYNHEDLGGCFEKLDRHIRAHLETIVPTNCLSVPLTQTADYFYEGEIADGRSFGRAQWILGVHARMGDAELIVKAPQLVKICSAKFVGELVRRAIAGLALTHMPVPPSAVPATVETQYFAISRDGPFWQHIVQTSRIGVYVPGDFPEAELQLLVLLEQ